VGSSDAALATWRVTASPDGADIAADPVEHWPTAVRVVGATAQGDVSYVLLESLAALDQPGGLHGVWIDARDATSPFDASPLALADIHDLADLQQRLKAPPHRASEQEAATVAAALHAASASGPALLRAASSAGIDVGVVWQSLFAQVTGHLDAHSPLDSAVLERALSIVRSALSTRACGVDACEAWTDRGRAVLRFALEDGKCVLRSILEDAQAGQPAHPTTDQQARHLVESSPDTSATASVLASHMRGATRVIGEAALAGSGGTIGVGLGDSAPGLPVVVVSEAGTSRFFPLPIGALRASTTRSEWGAAFADVDGDGRTDVVLRMSAVRGDGSGVTWAQAFLAPPPSVQASILSPDLVSALALMDASDATAAARAAISIPALAVTHEEACRILASASTPAGFRRTASAAARLLLFQEPGLPTWRPKVVPASQVAADQTSSLGAHCAELACDATRPYCVWSGGTDSLHVWFGRRDDRLELVGAADYDGE
jgi:hypothetical protein